MKTIHSILIGIVVLISISACGTKPDIEPEMSLGEISQSQLFVNNKVFADGFKSTQLSTEEIKSINSWPETLRVAIYFGTWCHDSQREVPRFLKIASTNNHISTQLVALDHHKTDPHGLAQNKGIKYTATFIVSIGDKEIGRIIERPRESLVTDISNMLQKL